MLTCQNWQVNRFYPALTNLLMYEQLHDANTRRHRHTHTYTHCLMEADPTLFVKRLRTDYSYLISIYYYTLLKFIRILHLKAGEVMDTNSYKLSKSSQSSPREFGGE